MFTFLSSSSTNFPNPLHADKDGLLAIGGDLSVARLKLAYSQGIFPWYSDDEPILWYAPKKRCVIFPENLKISKSMLQVIRSNKFEIRVNTAFEAVLEACATMPRKGQDGTWITDDLQKGILGLHQIGMAISVETWQDNQLVGGLYGIQVGKVFCGESMFSKISNASKFALIHLSHNMGFELVDCQIENAHLMSLGATLISNKAFLEIIKRQKSPAATQ